MSHPAPSHRASIDVRPTGAATARALRRAVRTGVAACGFVAASGWLAPAGAVGTSIDVQVVDRASGETIEAILHRGQWWIAGRPGARYGVVINSRNGRRTLNVISVDGVNAFTGASAAWNQSGYVLDPFERTEIDGWRKSLDHVAAFEFTALPDSYAARTGRPADVGVIGVATFGERQRQPARTNTPPFAVNPEPSIAPPAVPGPAAPLPDAPASQRRAPPPAAPAPPVAFDRADALELARTAPGSEASRERLGTGHGALESSPVRYVRFERARDTPDEVVTIRYDRLENLIAMGIVPAQPPVARGPFPEAFPASRRFVADPPRR